MKKIGISFVQISIVKKKTNSKISKNRTGNSLTGCDEERKIFSLQKNFFPHTIFCIQYVEENIDANKASL